MKRPCFLLSLLFPGIFAGQAGCPMDANGLQQCKGSPAEDDTLLMQLKNPRSSGALLQVSDLVSQNGGTSHSSVASLAESMRDLAVKSTSGQTVPANMMSILDSITGHMQSIRDGIQTEHNNDATLVNNANASIHGCVQATNTAFQTTHGISSQASATGNQATALAGCRTEEAWALGNETQKCTHFDDWLADLRRDHPNCVSSGQGCSLPASEPDLLQCQKDVEAWSQTYSAASHEAKKAACTSDTNAHTTKKATCDANQVTYEREYTAYAQALTTTCDEQTACFVREEDAKNSTCTLVLSNAGVRRSEYIASKKVTCYIEVLKIDESNGAAKKTKLEECDRSVDATSLVITCPPSPSPAACDTSVITPQPCPDCAEIVITTASAGPAQTIASTVASGQTVQVDTSAGCIRQSSLSLDGNIVATGSAPLCISVTGAFSISAGASLDLSGADGEHGNHNSNSAGGGGGGGAIKISAGSINIAGSLLADGGRGGMYSGDRGDGGARTSKGGAGGPGGFFGGCGCYGNLGYAGGLSHSHDQCAGVRNRNEDPTRCGGGCCGTAGGGSGGGQEGGVDTQSYGGGGGGGGNGAAGTVGTSCSSYYEGAGGAVMTRTELSGGSGGGGGGDDSDNEEGGGGGGAGGTIWLASPTITITGTVRANGGSGGSGRASCNGGAGGAGIIAYTGSLTGTTSPTATSVAADWVALP